MDDVWLKRNYHIMVFPVVKYTVKILLSCVNYLRPCDDSVPSPLLSTDFTVKSFFVCLSFYIIKLSLGLKASFTFQPPFVFNLQTQTLIYPMTVSDKGDCRVFFTTTNQFSDSGHQLGVQQFNSNTIYLELVSDSTDQGSVLQSSPHF